MKSLHRRSFLQLAAAALPARLFAQSTRSPSATPTSASAPVTAGQDRYGSKRALPNGTTAFKVSSQDCKGDFFAMEHHHTKKGGPVRHFHHVEDEWFYVLEGEYVIEVGGTLHKLTAGDSLLGPRGVPHAFAYIGNTSGKLLITYAPGGRMEEFFTAQDQRPSGRTYGGNIEMMAAYGMTYTGPPLSVS